MLRAVFVLLLLIALAAIPGRAADRFYLHDGDRVLFLGDSITNAGGYVQYVEAYLLTRFPDQRFELINLGLSSEGVTGLSEPDHPFPRPNVHERLERALDKVHPSVVVACYGMNDGIYYPFDAQRFNRYQAAIGELREKVRRAGARLTLITPPPFDPVPLGDRALPDGAPKYSWVQPYARYDDVLERYSRWLLSLRSSDLPVADAHHETHAFLNTIRKAEPAVRLADDGVHPDVNGQWLIAQALLREWGAPAEADRAEIDRRSLEVEHGDVRQPSAEGDGLRFEWRSRLPMPEDPQWNPRMGRIQRIGEKLNRYTLKVTGLRKGSYDLLEGDHRFGAATAGELARGVDLRQYPDLPTNRRAAELLTVVRAWERLLSPAWLTSVGHTRPDTPVGLPLEEAQGRAAPLQIRMRELARPTILSLRIRRSGAAP